MEEDKIRRFVEDLDPEGKISQDKIEEFISSVKELEKKPLENSTKIGDLTFDLIKEKIKDNTDWRIRASLAAKMISLKLEE